MFIKNKTIISLYNIINLLTEKISARLALNDFKM